MKQEEKDLLLKYLCAALPFNVIVECSINSGESVDLFLNTSHIDELTNGSLIIKPYLRPMSSMTEEEEEELNNLLDKELKDSEPYFVYEQLMVDFYLSHHLDNRLMIEKGLAIEVTEENNPYKE